MKRSFGLGLVVLAAVVIAPVALSAPSLAQWREMGAALAQQIRRPQVKLVLQAEKQVQTVDQQGQPQFTWEALKGEATVHPGDRLRYTLASENEGELAAKNLVITQPIPEQMKYVFDSAKSNNEAYITYSIDEGKTFVETPLVKVTLPDGTVQEQPAPAEAYTHIRWSFADSLAPAIALQVSYSTDVE